MSSTGYSIDDDKISFVTLNSATLNLTTPTANNCNLLDATKINPGGLCSIISSNNNFLYISGNFKSNTGTLNLSKNILINESNFSIFKNIKITGSDKNNDAITIKNSNSLYLRGLKLNNFYIATTLDSLTNSYFMTLKQATQQNLV
jgi:hypothetical protein